MDSHREPSQGSEPATPNGEHPRRIHGDQVLYERLRQQGFRGPEWDRFARMLAEYGVAVITAWVVTMQIPAKCRSLKIHLPAPVWAEGRQWSQDEVDELVIGVDPSDASGTSEAFAVLAGLVLEATGVPRVDVERAVAPGIGPGVDEDPDADEDERRGSRTQELAVAQLQALAGRLPASVLDATAAHLRTVLGDAWPRLGPDVHRMVVTAVHFGVTAPDGADLAGPVLGLCAPIERLLRNRLAEPALLHLRYRPGCDAGRWTLGTLLVRLKEAVSSPSGPAARALRRYLNEADIPSRTLADLLPELDRLRIRHRNKAAHQGLVEPPQWAEVYRTVLAADQALLPRLVALLPALSTPPSGHNQLEG